MRSTQRLALLLLAVGGALALIAYGQPWVTAVDAVAGLPATTRTLSGRDLEPGAGFLPLLLLAAVLALWATGGWLRRVVGAVAVLAGLAVAWGAVRAAPPLLDTTRLDVGAGGSYDTSWWWLVAAVAGLLAAAGGALVVARGGRWAGMSARYQRTPTGGARPGRTRSTWELLDAGVDPTDDAPGVPPSPDGASGTMQGSEPTRGRDTPGEDR